MGREDDTRNALVTAGEEVVKDLLTSAAQLLLEAATTDLSLPIKVCFLVILKI